MWLVGRPLPGKVYLGISRSDLLRFLPDVISFRENVLDGPLRNSNLLPRAVSPTLSPPKETQDPKVNNRPQRTCPYLVFDSNSPYPGFSLCLSIFWVSMIFLSLAHTHQSFCKSSQLFRRNSATVHGRPIPPSTNQPPNPTFNIMNKAEQNKPCLWSSSGVGNAFLSQKNPQRPWSGSTFTAVRSEASRTGSGSGNSETDI